MHESRGKGYWCGLGLVGVLLLAEAAMAMPEPIAKSLNRKTLADQKIEIVEQTADLPTLELDNPIKREIGAAEAHSYQIFLEAGQYLRVTVAQPGIDVVVTLFDPSGTQVLEVDNLGVGSSDEIAIVAEVEGNYRLQIRPFYSAAASGEYEVQVEEVRAATLADRNRFVAYRTLAEARQL